MKITCWIVEQLLKSGCNLLRLQSVKASQVLIFLNTLFSIFDRLTDVHGVHKVTACSGQ